MLPETIGVRELKANLSACLRRVKAGQSIVITERGKPVGRIAPMEAALGEKLQAGVQSRFWSWNGKRWRPAAPRIETRNGMLVSELLLDDRE